MMHNENAEVSRLLERLKEISRLVSGAAEAHTLKNVLKRIAEATREMAGVRYAAIGVPDEEGRMAHFEVAGLSAEQIAHIPHPPVGAGLLGAIIHDRQTLRLPNMQEDSRSVGFPANHPHMQSLLGTPILAGDKLVGMIYLCDREDGQPFTEQDQWLVETIASYAALAVAGARLRETEQRLSLFEERERISMELHDGVIQHLYALGMNLELMRHESSLDTGRIQPVIRGLDEAIEDIRRYILNLKRSHDGQETLCDCIDKLVGRLSIPESLCISVKAPNELPLLSGPELENACSILYEALSNAVRHAQAQNITITAAQDNGWFHANIADDGRGFEPALLEQHEGLGLRNIRRRAEIKGGSVTIDSSVGGGTSLTLALPLEQPRASL